VQVALDVLDGDDGLVHQDAHRQRQAAQGHEVEVSPSAASIRMAAMMDSGMVSR
jgi:hypothetical protein